MSLMHMGKLFLGLVLVGVVVLTTALCCVVLV